MIQNFKINILTTLLKTNSKLEKDQLCEMSQLQKLGEVL